MATITTTTTVRTVFSKLSAAMSLTLTGASPFQQFDATQTNNDRWVPNRAVTPTYIAPSISVSAPDGTLSYTGAPTSVAWYVNGVAIATAWTVNTDYTILTAADSAGHPKGTLVVKKNLAASVRSSITCTATYTDTRTGQNVVVESRAVVFGTTLKTVTGLALRSELPHTFVYNAALDALEDAEFNASKNSATVAAADLTRLQASPTAYLRKYPVRMYSGSREMSAAAYTVKVQKVSGTSLTNVTAAANSAVQQISQTSVWIDARYLPVGDTVYRVTATLTSDTTVSRSFDIKVRRVAPTLDYRIVNTSSLDPTKTNRTEEVEVWCGNRLLRNPERIVDFTWKSSLTKSGASSATVKTLGTGPKVTYALTATGATATELNNRTVTSIDISLEATLKGPKTS